MYKIIDNSLVKYNNPLETKEGLITNPTIEILKAEGYKQLKQNIPTYNKDTHYILLTSYTEDDNYIYENYEIKEMLCKPPTIDERLKKLENTDIDLIATNWDMDDRILEIEWLLEDMQISKKINFNLKGVGNMAGLSKFEQAKILILAGEYNREVMEKQLRKYESRGLITKDELDILISMMDANELVQGQ